MVFNDYVTVCEGCCRYYSAFQKAGGFHIIPCTCPSENHKYADASGVERLFG